LSDSSPTILLKSAILYAPPRSVPAMYFSRESFLSFLYWFDALFPSHSFTDAWTFCPHSFPLTRYIQEMSPVSPLISRLTPLSRPHLSSDLPVASTNPPVFSAAGRFSPFSRSAHPPRLRFFFWSNCRRAQAPAPLPWLLTHSAFIKVFQYSFSPGS